jgi:acetylornithine deacetylase
VGIVNPDAKKSLALNAHIDTVPTGLHEEWTETDGNPFNPVIKNGRMYGRGATDDKGPAACIIKATEAIFRAGFKPKGQLQLHLTVGEETGEGETLGPGWFVRQNPKFKTDACIVAESSAPPHPLGICLTSPGVSLLNITVKGKPVHAAMRYRTIRAGYEGEDIGVSAVDKGFKIYRALYELEQEWGLKPDPSGLTSYGFPSIPIGWIKGNPKGIELPFFIADHCEFGMAVWRYWWEKPEDVRTEVNRVIDRVVQSDHWLRDNPPTIDWSYDWPPFRIEEDHPLTRVVATSYQAVLNQKARYQSWQPVSDARWYQDAGVPSILIGPGDYRVAHALNESIELDQLLPARKIYALAVMDWLGYE